MKKFSLAVCVLLAFAISALAQQQLKWIQFTEPNLKFAALFPSDPVRNAPDVSKGDDGSVRSTGYLFVARSQDAYVAIAGRTDYNFTVDAEGELVADRDNFVKATRTKLMNSRRYDFSSGDEKLPAMDFSSEDDAWFYKGFFIVKGNNTYCALFGHVRGQDYGSAAEKFLGSFEITK